MSFPECLQAADAPTGSDHLDVRDVANDFKHWAPVTAAASGHASQPITDGVPGELRFPALATRRKTTPRRCPRLPNRGTPEESRRGSVLRRLAQPLCRRSHACPDAGLPAHY